VHPVWDRYGKGRMIIGAHVFFHDVPDGERIRPAPARATRAASVSSHLGPRAGRVNGVIQYAPESMARQMLPGERPGDLPPPAPVATTPAVATPLGPSGSVT
jgi:hypothetical protein